MNGLIRYVCAGARAGLVLAGGADTADAVPAGIAGVLGLGIVLLLGAAAWRERTKKVG